MTREVKVKGTVMLASLIFHREGLQSWNSASHGRQLVVRLA